MEMGDIEEFGLIYKKLKISLYGSFDTLFHIIKENKEERRTALLKHFLWQLLAEIKYINSNNYNAIINHIEEILLNKGE